MLLPNSLVTVLTLAGLGVASAALFPLTDVARLSPKRGVKRAWRALSAMLVFCIVLQAWILTTGYSRVSDGHDLPSALLHLLGPLFVFTVAWLSKQTAKDALQMARFEHDAMFDLLTGLPNRRSFEASLASRIQSGPSPALSRAHLFLFDLDHFKTINATYGHAAGDLVLARVGTLIAEHIRAPATAYRIGGEEFAALVHGLHPDQAVRSVEQLRRDLEQTIFLLPDGTQARVTLSVGMASLRPSDSPESFLKRADDALYQAKRSGRNRLRWAA